MPRIVEVTHHDQVRPIKAGVQPTDLKLPGVMIRPQVLSAIYDHAQRGYPIEIAGHYVGWPLLDVETGLPITYIEQSLEAITTGTPTHVTIHPESLIAVDALCKRTGTLLVGYYHSHPGLSVFQSGTDTSYYGDYFREPYQIAIVVDPTRTSKDKLDPRGEWIGFFAWNSHQTPTRLPAGNIWLIRERPTIVEEHIGRPITSSVAATAISSVIVPEAANEVRAESSERAEIAKEIWKVIELLRGNRGSFNSELPVLLFPAALARTLSERGAVTSEPGAGPVLQLLEGIVWRGAGYDFFCLLGSTPIDLQTLTMYDDYAIKNRRKLAWRHLLKRDQLAVEAPVLPIPGSRQDLEVLGIAADSETLVRSGFLAPQKRGVSRIWAGRSSWLVQSRDTYCLVALLPEQVGGHTQAALQFKALRLRDQQMLSIPDHNTVALE